MSTASEKVLLIGSELNEDAQLKRFLEREGLVVIEAIDQKEGLVAARNEQPFIVLIDHRLPDQGDGVEVLKAVRQASPASEVVLVTTGGEMQAAIEVLRAGALDYLHRPLDTKLLRVALGRARERRPQRQQLAPASLLVLEDHEPTRARLVNILHKEGYQVHAAADGEAGMELFARQRVDVVLVDVKMPKKDGLQVLQETKAAGADVEVIVMTGYGDEEIVVSALRAGAINFLRKPIDIEQMLLAIEKALEHLTLRRSLAHRNRDIELMQEMVVRLTSKLELVVETPVKLSAAATGFLQQLVDSLPLGIVVANAEGKIIFANRHVVEKVGQTPPMMATDWLSTMGVSIPAPEELNDAFTTALEATPGAVRTLVVSRWSFLVMTPVKLVRPDLTERFVAVAIRGERKMK
jgi:DNA-binding NtrC family response regulator